MGKTRRRSTRRHSGGGYQTSQQYLNPTVLPPQAGMLAPVVSTAPTADAIRPVLMSTFHGGRRRTLRGSRRLRGGFSPSVMGGFIPNAQAAIVPAALYMVYHTFVPKGARGKATLRSISRKAGSAFKKLSGK
jgi:hypothetical protein